MRGNIILLAGPAFLAMCVNSAAVAGSPSTTGKKTKDPNEVICEKVEVVGSRLAVQKICATRAQWAERRLQDRMAIDKAQKIGKDGGE